MRGEFRVMQCDLAKLHHKPKSYAKQYRPQNDLLSNSPSKRNSPHDKSCSCPITIIPSPPLFRKPSHLVHRSSKVAIMRSLILFLPVFSSVAHALGVHRILHGRQDELEIATYDDACNIGYCSVMGA